MYAIIADGGRQYRVEEGQELEVDYREIPTGENIKFDRVLAVSGNEGFQLGTPTVAGMSVTAEVLGVTQGEKLTVQKMRRRKNSRRKTGHRQWHLKVRIGTIGSGTERKETAGAVQADQTESEADQDDKQAAEAQTTQAATSHTEPETI
jgi:large subunit ribosomal protein L21